MCQMCDLSFVGYAEPQEAMLDSYVAALKRGWSPHTEIDVSGQQLAAIASNKAVFLGGLRDERPPDMVTLPDGREVPRLPQRIRWIWDGDFCGQINLRWQPGAAALPDHVLGHVGYTIVEWKRGHGLGKRALRHMLSEARDIGLTHLEICTTEANVASQRVITANGGALIEAFRSPLWGADIIRQRYRIEL